MKKILCCTLIIGVCAIVAESHAQTVQPEVDGQPDGKMSTVVVADIKDRDMMKYSDAFSQMTAFKKLPDTDKIYLRFFVELKKNSPKKMSDIVVTLDSENLHTPILLETDGTLQIPFSVDANAESADINTNQGGSTIKIYYGPGIKVPEGTTFKYRDIMDGVKQSTSMMKSFWNFLFPSFKGAGLRYANANGQYLTIHASGGDEKIDIDPVKKSIPVEFDPVLYRENPTVIVSERPEKILPFNVRPSKF